MRPGEMIVSGDMARRLRDKFGLSFKDERVENAMRFKTFKARMNALKALHLALEGGSK